MVASNVGQPRGAGGPRHVVLSLGIALTRTEDGDSPRFGLDVLEEAPVHADRVAKILEEFRYTTLRPTAVPEGLAGYGKLVEAAVEAEDADVLIVHIVGHGELAAGSSEKLYILGSDGNRLGRPVGEWIDLIEDHPGRHRPMTLFVLDVCYAGQAAVTAWHSRMDVDKRRAWVLAATGRASSRSGGRSNASTGRSKCGRSRCGRSSFHPTCSASGDGQSTFRRPKVWDTDQHVGRRGGGPSGSEN
ncbi:hypothetical protein KNE206_52590 [Kitasatospora sp. NE20-6]